ncbi:MAG TPA: DNA polymerase Y family protein [Symbiobacteriaceae bacterium]
MQWVCFLEVQGLYAAAARQAGLVPADRPVVVLREGRVVDGCRQAFAAGLVPEAPARQVLRDVPQAVCVDQREIEGKRFARSWWDRCLTHVPYVEPVEPHQLFLVLPHPGKEITEALRAEVACLQELSAAYGFVAFAGVGSSRLVARAAARTCREGWLQRRPGLPGQGRPVTAAFVQPGQEAPFLAGLPVDYLPVPADVLQRIKRLGLRRIGEAAQLPEDEWVRQLGPLGRQVFRWSRGVDPEPVRPCYPPRALEHRVSFTPELRDRDRLEQAVNRWAAVLSRRLAEKEEGCQQVALVLELPGGTRVEVERTLPRLQQAPYPIQQALQRLLAQALEEAASRGAPEGQEPAVSAVTLRLSQIGPMPHLQLNLWDDALRRQREGRLQQALLLLQERFPPRLVGLGPRQDLSWREQMLQFADPFRWVHP